MTITRTWHRRLQTSITVLSTRHRRCATFFEHPDSYHMPCLTPNAMRNVKAMPEGAKQRWNEFDLTYSYYPGQTLFHGGLLLKKDGGENIFFIGDSFTPTGVDDYCLTNRN